MRACAKMPMVGVTVGIGIGIGMAGAGCTGGTYIEQITPTPISTPYPIEDPDGQAPDWTSCQEGYEAFYYNLPSTHADVEPEATLSPGAMPELFDWWDESYWVYSRYEASTDFGVGWYPVDSGYAGDPDYFAVKLSAWFRVKTNNTPVTFRVGAATDVWIEAGEERVAFPGPRAFEVVTETRTFAANQYPLTVWFASRVKGESGLILSISGQDVRVCYPQYD